MTYPVQGGTWELEDAEVDKLQAVYRRLDVREECQKAWLWLEANPGKRKTARGMPRFVLGWLNRAAQLHAVRPSPLDAPRPTTPPLWFASRECPHAPKCQSRQQCEVQDAARRPADRGVY